MVWILFLLLGFPLSRAISPKTYGSYSIRWGEFDVCKGPKLSNLTSYNATVFDGADGHLLELNMTVITPSQLELLKVSVYTINMRHKSKLWNYKVEKVCEHAVIGPIIGQYLPLDTCVIVKGNHRIVINFTELALTFLGSKFYYGEYFFKIVVVAKKGNVACLQLDVQFLKK